MEKRSSITEEEIEKITKLNMMTLKDIQFDEWSNANKLFCFSKDLKAHARKLLANLQGPDTVYPLIINKVPDYMKGQIALDKWNDPYFKLGTEYGMIAMLWHIFDLEDDE